MKIIIFSYSFYPQVSARANRAFELAKELARQGNDIEVITIDSGFNYENIEKKYNFKIKKMLLMKEKKEINVINDNLIGNFKFFKSFIRYLIGGEWNILKTKKYFTDFSKLLEGKYDMGISIGLPFNTHLVYFLVNKKYNFAKVSIADYGDPYSRSKILKKMKIYNKLEKKVANSFDFITVPVKEAVESYSFIEKKQKIKIIPQGFDISIINDNYLKNKKTTFAFAGNFYEEIRNPKNLFDVLSTYDLDFKFILYVNCDDSNQKKMINYGKEKLNEKIEINNFIDRKECLNRLNKMDFLINLENMSKNQIPSKLIDYALSLRPILNINPKMINEEHLKEFIMGNYNNKVKIEIDDYDIKKIANKFLELGDEK